MSSTDEGRFSATCPWFYPVVEQHDVTYHRVKPLVGHREKRLQEEMTEAQNSTGTKKISNFENQIK